MGKTILVLSVFAVWCFVCQQWYVCGIKQACATAIGQSNPATLPTPTIQRTNQTDLPITFRWQSAQPILGATFPAYRDSILRELGDKDTLQITAFYYRTENNPTDSITYGAERARALQQLFVERLPKQRIKLVQKSKPLRPGVRKSPFAASQIKQLISSTEATDTATPVVRLADGVRIYFGFNAAAGDMDAAIEDYLNELADSLILRGHTVRITGHTDNVGEAKANYNVGLRRAKSVRNYLRERGVPRSQIQTFSKGETEPIATNATENGMAQNRRTEIKIIR